MQVVTASSSTQTELNFELLNSFIHRDLPRLIAMELSPIRIEMMRMPDQEFDPSTGTYKSLQSKIEDLVRMVVDKNSPFTHQPQFIVADVRRNGRTISQQEVFDRTTLPGPVCNVCGKQFTIYPELTAHLDKEHTAPHVEFLQCNLCTQFKSKSPTELANHINCYHLNGLDGRRTSRYYTPILCPICRMEFYSTTALQRHKITSHRRDISKCPKCKVLFEYPSQLTSHLKFSKSCGSTTTTLRSEQEGLADCQELTPTYAKLPNVADAAADMVGNALLNALGMDASKGDVTDGKITTNSVDKVSITEDLIMDVSTGQPIPISQYLLKRGDQLSMPNQILPASRVYKVSKGPDGTDLARKYVSSKFKCNVCGRQFSTVSMLLHHTEKVHIQQKTLSCTQCHLMFATFPELDSHFHRVHRKRNPSTDINHTDKHTNKYIKHTDSKKQKSTETKKQISTETKKEEVTEEPALPAMIVEDCVFEETVNTFETVFEVEPEPPKLTTTRSGRSSKAVKRYC